MTRKDYILIARAIATANAIVDDQGWDHRVYGQIMADALIGTNPRFDKDRFLTAAGVA